MSFEMFSLDPLVFDALKDMGIEKPTAIQENSIPLILKGKDVMALAETGSGKTAAASIPICHKVDTSLPHIQALIVVPTRELALQYATEMQKIGRIKKVKAFALYGGGDNFELQVAKLRAGVHVLVATPGRLIDFIYSRSIVLTSVQTLVLDEADHMLSMGFYEDLEFIMQCLIQEHQTLLFSATMPKEIKKIARFHMNEPVEISLIDENPTPSKLVHNFYFCPDFNQKTEELSWLVKELDPTAAIIFANSRFEVERLFKDLKSRMSSIDFLHGGLDQSLRSSITAKFSKNKVRFLIATDIASRGLDFSKVTHVINFSMPHDSETYLHRAGRSGRVGREGMCVTLVTKRDLAKAKRLMKMVQGSKWMKEEKN